MLVLQFQVPQEPNHILYPSPSEFLAGCVIYSLAIMTFYQIRKDDHLQNYFLVGGTITVFALGLAYGADVRGILVDLMRWVVLLLILISAGVHMLFHGSP